MTGNIRVIEDKNKFISSLGNPIMRSKSIVILILFPAYNTTAEFTIFGEVMENPIFPNCYLSMYLYSRIRYFTIRSKLFFEKLRFVQMVITRASWRLYEVPFFIVSCGLCIFVFFSFERC